MLIEIHNNILFSNCLIFITVHPSLKYIHVYSIQPTRKNFAIVYICPLYIHVDVDNDVCF